MRTAIARIDMSTMKQGIYLLLIPLYALQAHFHFNKFVIMGYKNWLQKSNKQLDQRHNVNTQT